MLSTPHCLNRTLPECVPFSTGNIADNWNLLQTKVLSWNGQSLLSPWGVKILREGLDKKLKTVLVEPHYICKDHRDLFSHYYSRKFRVNPDVCSRLHFFSTVFKSPLDFFESPDEHRKQYIGFSVIRPVPERCIGRTVFDPAKLDVAFGKSFFCLRTMFKAHVNGIELGVKGYPYMSQDNEAMLCAHAALWGMCRYMSERYPIYREVRPFDLVRMTGKDLGRAYPGRGMVYRDYSSILTDFGSYPVIEQVKEHSEDKTQDKEALRNICTYVESGFPVLLSVKNPASRSGHALTAVGHTLDETDVILDADGIIDHTDFFKQLIVVDDNVFPYQLLGRKADPNNYASAFDEDFRFSMDDIHTAVCPLPEKVFVTAEVARMLLRKHLTDRELWPEIQKTGQSPWVTRLFLATCHSFKKGKFRAAGQNLGIAGNLDYVTTLTLMPHFIWVMEIGPRERYRQRECTAEIVLDATAGKNDYSLVLYARVGNKLFFPQADRPFECQGASSVFKIYRHNLGEEPNNDIH